MKKQYKLSSRLMAIRLERIELAAQRAYYVSQGRVIAHERGPFPKARVHSWYCKLRNQNCHCKQ